MRHVSNSKVQTVCNYDCPLLNDAVHLLDQCTRIPRQERLLLRNMVKQSGKGDLSEKQKEVLELFVEADRKKALHKCAKDSRFKEELQTKLRKVMNRWKQRQRSPQYIALALSHRKIQQRNQDIAYALRRNSRHSSRMVSHKSKTQQSIESPRFAEKEQGTRKLVLRKIKEKNNYVRSVQLRLSNSKHNIDVSAKINKSKYLLSQHSIEKIQNTSTPSTYEKQKNKQQMQCLFTPPQLLRQCRQLIQNHSKLKQSMRQQRRNEGTKQPQNESASYIVIKDCSPRLKLHSVRYLLLNLFPDTHQRRLSLRNFQQLIGEHEEVFQLPLREYLNYVVRSHPRSMLQSQFFTLNFITLCRFLSAAPPSGALSLTLRQILTAKERIRQADAQCLLHSLEQGGADTHIILQIQLKFNRVFSQALVVEQSEILIKSQEEEFEELEISAWSLYFLEIKQSKVFVELCELLDHFQFSLD